MSGFGGGVWLERDWAGCLAVTDWATWGLWAAASAVAASLLGVAMNRRRQTLTETLREHVTNTIGPPTHGGEAESEEIGGDTPV